MNDGRLSKLTALDAIRDDRHLTSAERLVLLMLIAHVKPSDGTCFPSLELLAKETGLSRSTVAAALGSLRARTDSPVAVTVVHRGRGTQGGGRASNVYQLSLRPITGPKSNPVESEEQTQPTFTLSPPDGPKPLPVESDGATQPVGHLSPTDGGLESKRGGELSPPAGHEAGQEAGHLNRSGSSKRSPKTDQPPNPNGPKLWEHYHAEHKRLRGVEPKFTGRQRGGVGRAWKDMLEVLDFDEAKLVVTRALEAGYHVQPTAIVANLNRYRGNQAIGGRGVQVQRGANEAEANSWGRAKGYALGRGPKQPNAGLWKPVVES